MRVLCCASRSRILRQRPWPFVDTTHRLLAGLSSGAEDEHGRGPLVAEFHRKLGERGWNATNWPKEYGGLETSAVQRLILMDELYYWQAPRLEYAEAI